MSQDVAAGEDTLVLKRTFTAPVEKVYQAWTDPAQMVRWFSSNTRWLSPEIDTELKPGGRHNITMRHSDGDKFQMNGNYVEIVSNKRISFTWKMAKDPTGGKDQLVTIELEAVPGGTELTLIHSNLIDAKDKEETTSGWTGFFDMLESYLGGNPPFTP